MGTRGEDRKVESFRSREVTRESRNTYLLSSFIDNGQA